MLMNYLFLSCLRETFCHHTTSILTSTLRLEYLYYHQHKSLRVNYEFLFEYSCFAFFDFGATKPIIGITNLRGFHFCHQKLKWQSHYYSSWQIWNDRHHGGNIKQCSKQHVLSNLAIYHKLTLLIGWYSCCAKRIVNL